jgi:hypothetical protein
MLLWEAGDKRSLWTKNEPVYDGFAITYKIGS